jgi:acetyl-CoA carboxylase biotin carboxylase subunit
MGEIAVKAARRLKYRNAGTIEFLVDQEQNFYFLEMNTRLQVEHPVTEMVTGIDIVKAQIEIARGAIINLKQEELAQWGHAIECRIYAEDPTRDFAPCPGRIDGLKLPKSSFVRVGNGYYPGAEVPLYYDPL